MLQMKKIMGLLLLCSLSLGLTHCAAPAVQINKFTLAPDLQWVPRVRSTGTTLLVSKPVAAPGVNTEKMAYSQQPSQINYFSKNEWVGTPAEMLMPLIAGSLQNTQHFRAVVSQPFTGITSLRLDTQLLSFERRYRSLFDSDFIIVMRAELINKTSERIIAAQTFTVVQPVDGTSPYAGVNAANLAVDQLLQQLARFCVRYS